MLCACVQFGVHNFGFICVAVIVPLFFVPSTCGFVRRGKMYDVVILGSYVLNAISARFSLPRRTKTHVEGTRLGSKIHFPQVYTAGNSLKLHPRTVYGSHLQLCKGKIRADFSNLFIALFVYCGF